MQGRPHTKWSMNMVTIICFLAPSICSLSPLIHTVPAPPPPPNAKTQSLGKSHVEKSGLVAFLADTCFFRRVVKEGVKAMQGRFSHLHRRGAGGQVA